MEEIEAQAYLERIAESGSILGLKSIRELMAELGNVQEQLTYIHVAGTNGKGSVCAMISSILKEAGILVGTYTSPAVFNRREQYRVNGKMISSREFSDIIAQVREACGRMTAKGKRQPTVFEAETAAAFLYFYNKKCQAVVLETGMGGDKDATNIIERPLVSVLTSISRDHMGVLGDSLEEIARVKTGIIKEGCLTIAAAPKQESVRKIIEDSCSEKHADLIYADLRKVRNVRISTKEGKRTLCFEYNGLGEARLLLTGACQIENAVCAIEAARALRSRGFAITDQNIQAGLYHARCEGRFSTICQKPWIVMDGAHNADAAKKLRETLQMGFTNKKIIYIIGVLADKEYQEILKIMLPLAQRVYTVTPGHPRAMDGRKLAEEARKYHGAVSFCPTLQEAAQRAKSDACAEDSMILAFGSLSYLKELRDILKEK